MYTGETAVNMWMASRSGNPEFRLSRIWSVAAIHFFPLLTKHPPI